MCSCKSEIFFSHKAFHSCFPHHHTHLLCLLCWLLALINKSSLQLFPTTTIESERERVRVQERGESLSLTLLRFLAAHYSHNWLIDQPIILTKSGSSFLIIITFFLSHSSLSTTPDQLAFFDFEQPPYPHTLSPLNYFSISLFFYELS